MERKATPGPWATDEYGNVNRPGAEWHASIKLIGFSMACGYTPKSDPCYADRDLLAALRNAAPALIAELRRLRKIEDAARKVSESSVLALEDALEQLDEAVKEKANG